MLIPLFTIFFLFYLLETAMPNRCNVANCTSNYDGTEYTPVFEMLNHWPKEVQDEWRKFYIEMMPGN